MNINNLQEFDQIKKIRVDIKKMVEKINARKNEMTKYYKEYTKKEHDDFFGLDSFQSQIKLVDLEYDNIYNMYIFLENRIYGDYYKLLSMIYKYLTTTLQDKRKQNLKQLNNFNHYPKHNLLKQYEKYNFNTINEIHHDIIIILHEVDEIIIENTNDIKQNEQKLKLGMKIDNYVNNYTYKNETLRTTNIFYNNYLRVYHKYHFEMLKKFHEKAELMFEHMSHDLNSHERYHIQSQCNENVDSDQHSGTKKTNV